MLIVGGSGNNRGAIAGAIAIWGVWALSSSAIAAVFPAGEQARAASLQIVLIGVALCAMLLWRPRGLLGEVAIVSRHLAEFSADVGRQPALARKQERGDGRET
jgi:branched-chain amino acid transport system permease protein